MKIEDIPCVVNVHLRGFPGFFLSFLGEKFLHELYQTVLSDPSGIAIVYDQGDLLGFVAGSDQPSGFYRRAICSRLLRFFLASISPVLRQPSIIPRLFRAFNTPVDEDPGEGCGTLMSIAVLPEAQGKGIGSQLLRAFLDQAAARGLAEVNLTTDRRGNEDVNHFYQSYGFRLERTYVTPEGREINEYRIRVSS